MKYLIFSIFISFAVTGYSEESAVPKGFKWQALEITGGRLLMPEDWHFMEAHRAMESLRWIASKEDAKTKHGAYDTGFSVNLMSGYKTSSKALIEKLAAQISAGGQVVSDCKEQQIGNMYRICIEKIEKNQSGKEYHVMYTLMWWKDVKLVAYTSAGTPVALWKDYQPVFNKMSEVDVINLEKIK